MPRIRRHLTICFAACGLALASPAIATAGTGTLSGKLTGLPGGDQFAVVTVVNAQGVITALATTSASGAYSVKVTPGVYVVIGEAATSRGKVLDATGAPIRVRSGHHSSERSKLKSDKYSKGKPTAADVFGGPLTAPDATDPPAQAADAPSIAAKPLPKDAIVTADPMLVDDLIVSSQGVEEGPDRSLVVLHSFYGPCTAKGVKFVDTSPEFTKFAKQESAMQKAGMLSPSTPFSYHPIKPTYLLQNGMDISINSDNDPDLGIDLVLQHIPITSPGATIAEAEGDTVAGVGTTFDDTFITSTLINEYANPLAAATCG